MFSRSPNNYRYIINKTLEHWERINKRALYKSISSLYKSKLVDGKDNSDGTTTIFLTNKGKNKALTYKLDEIKIPSMKKWDKKWRIILFDIPEKFKKARNALAGLLKNMGFYPLQKSVFVYPFECTNETDFVIEFFNLRPYVRYILAEHLDNEFHLKNHFEL